MHHLSAGVPKSAYGGSLWAASPGGDPEHLPTSSLPGCHIPPTATALEDQTRVLPGDTTPAGRCTPNQTEAPKASAETDRNKEQGKTGAVPPRCTLRSPLFSVASFEKEDPTSALSICAASPQDPAQLDPRLGIQPPPPVCFCLRQI